MKAFDKLRIRAAFQKAIDRDPAAADLPVEGWSRDGRPMSSRQIINATLMSDDFYAQIDAALKQGRKLEDFLDDFERARLPLRNRAKDAPTWRA